MSNHNCGFQNQIAAQQAVYVKHQQHTPPTTEFFKSSLHEPISALHPNFSDLSLKDPPVSYNSIYKLLKVRKKCH